MHRALKEYLQQHQLAEKLNGHERVHLAFDHNTRVDCYPGQQGQWVLESVLLSLPPSMRDQDTLLERMATAMAARLAQQRPVLALVDNASTAVLQASLPATATLAELEAVLADLVEAVDDWRFALGLD